MIRKRKSRHKIDMSVKLFKILSAVCRVIFKIIDFVSMIVTRLRRCVNQCWVNIKRESAGLSKIKQEHDQSQLLAG